MTVNHIVKSHVIPVKDDARSDPHPCEINSKEDVQSYSTWKVEFTDLSRNAP